MRNIFIIISIISLFSCSLQVSDYRPDIPVVDEPFDQVDELFTGDESGCYTFETNNTEYNKKNGYTLWTSPFVNSDTDFENIDIDVQKLSGNDKASGYGIVFSRSKNKNDIMYVCLINESRQYLMGKVENGVFQTVSEKWHSSKYLYTGNNLINNIKVVSNYEKNNLQIKFNGGIEYEMDKILDNYENTSWGFVVVVSEREKFPEKSLKVKFKINK